MWATEIYGVTASGVPSTGAQNSFVRSYQEMCLGARKTGSVGDDNVKSNATCPIRAKQLFGTTVKAGSDKTTTFSEGVELCSHLYYPLENRAEFLNTEKMLVRLENKAELDYQTLIAMRCVLRNNGKELADFDDLLRRLNVDPVQVENMQCLVGDTQEYLD